MSTYGRNVLSQFGRDVAVLANLENAAFKVGGITIDWSLFAAVSGADVTLPDQNIIKIGEKYARFGQILCKVTRSEVQTIDLSGDDDPTGGTWDMTIFGVEITGIAWNVTAAALQALINALDHPYARDVTVSKSSFVYTVTFPPNAGNVDAITAVATDLTGGGDTFAITIATTTAGVASGGKYGPYDPSASDGRQTLSRGNCWVLNRTVKENGFGAALNNNVTDHPQVFDGGTVWKQRVLATSGSHTLAAGPTWSEFEAAFPRIDYAQK